MIAAKIVGVSVVGLFTLLLALRSGKSTPKIEKPVKRDEVCLPVGAPCLKSKYSCCKLSHRLSLIDHNLDPVTCFKFGEGICQTKQSIENFAEYERLESQLNSTNFQQLRKQYWASVTSATLRSAMKFQSNNKSSKPEKCIPLGKPCMASKNPCCTFVSSSTMIGLTTLSTTCFKFGNGTCQLNKNIRNFDEYKKLAQKLNSTNFQELKEKYWKSVAPATPRPTTKPPSAVKSSKPKQCLSLGEPCLKSKYPCCNGNTEIGTIGPGLLSVPVKDSIPVTCFKFGQGVCQKEKDIKNIGEYKKLAQQLNSTNFQELKKKYWASITPVILRYPTKSLSLEKAAVQKDCLPLGMPCLKSKYPCCELVYANKSIKSGPVATTCFKFGEGVCTVNQSITNFDEYKKLNQQLNSTNFQELRKKYWMSVVNIAFKVEEN